MKFVETWKRRRAKKYTILYKRGPSTLALIFAGMAMGLWAIFAFLSSYPVGLYLYYVSTDDGLLGKALQQTSIEMTAEAKPCTDRTGAETFTGIKADLPGTLSEYPKLGVDTVSRVVSDQYKQPCAKVWRVGV